MDLLTPSIGLIFWQAVGFLIVFIILRLFAWKPILNSLKARENAIAESLEMADIARKQTENLKSDNEKLLMEARMERENMMRDALAAADAIREQARSEAQEITNKMVNDAKVAISVEKNAALMEVKKLTADLSLEIAGKLLRKNLTTQKAQRELVDELLKEVNTN